MDLMSLLFAFTAFLTGIMETVVRHTQYIDYLASLGAVEAMNGL